MILDLRSYVDGLKQLLRGTLVTLTALLVLLRKLFISHHVAANMLTPSDHRLTWDSMKFRRLVL